MIVVPIIVEGEALEQLDELTVRASGKVTDEARSDVARALLRIGIAATIDGVPSRDERSADYERGRADALEAQLAAERTERERLERLVDELGVVRRARDATRWN